MQLCFRVFRIAVLVSPHMTDQVARFDRDGLIENHNAVRYGFAHTVQGVEVNILIDALQLTECAFAAGGNFRAMGQLHQCGAADVGFGAHAQ